MEQNEKNSQKVLTSQELLGDKLGEVQKDG